MFSDHGREIDDAVLHLIVGNEKAARMIAERAARRTCRLPSKVWKDVVESYNRVAESDGLDKIPVDSYDNPMSEKKTISRADYVKNYLATGVRVERRRVRELREEMTEILYSVGQLVEDGKLSEDDCFPGEASAQIAHVSTSLALAHNKLQVALHSLVARADADNVFSYTYRDEIDKKDE